MTSKKHLAALAFGAALALPAAASAQTIGHGRNVGLGLVAGYPGFGFSLNVFLNDHMSLQIDPTFFSWRRDFWVGARVDLLFYPGRPLVSRPAFDLRWYVGPGLTLAVSPNYGHAYLVPEVPIGIGFQFKRVPIDLMIEAVPQLWFATSRYEDRWGYFWVAGAIHARYYF